MQAGHGAGKIRHRSREIGGRQRVEVWLDRDGDEASYNTVSQDLLKMLAWPACPIDECLGSRLPPDGMCFLHMSNDAVRQYVSGVQAARGQLNLQGVEISEEIWSRAREARDVDGESLGIDCTAANFQFKVTEWSAVFGDTLVFSGATLAQGFDFKDCTFRNGVRLDYVDFGDNISHFTECKIYGNSQVNFLHGGRRSQIFFTDCLFSSDLYAEGVSGRRFSLNGCEMKVVILDRTSVEELSLMSCKAGGLSLSQVEVGQLFAANLECDSHQVGYVSARNKVDLSRARFRSRTTVVVEADELDLSGAVFEQGGRIEVNRSSVDLKRLASSGPLVISGRSHASVLTLTNADVDQMTLSSISLRECAFRDAPGLASISLEATVELDIAPGKLVARRRCVKDESLWRVANSRLRKRAWRSVLSRGRRPEDIVSSAAEIADLYRALRKSLETRSNEPGAADFYYGEMEMRRRDKESTLAERLVLNAYWLISGYGLRSFRSFVAIMALLILATFMMMWIGIDPSRSNFFDALLISTESMVPGVRIDVTLTHAGRIISLALKILGPILFALAALAVRNRVRR